MNIVIIIPSLVLGGAERMALLQARCFLQRGHNVTLMTLVKAKDFYCVPANIKRIHLNLIKTPFYKNPAAPLIRFFKIRQALIKLKTDIVLSNMSIIGCYGAWVAGIPFIFAEHVETTFCFRKTFILKKALSVTVLNEKDRNLFKTKSIPAQIIHNPAVKPEIKLDQKPPFYKNKIVLAVGRLVEEKGFDMLLEAWHKIKDKKDFTLVIAGGGPEKESLNKIIKENDIEKVILAGPQDDIGVLYKYADIFVSSSRKEAFPLNICEAMSFKLPVVAFNCIGTNIILGGGGGGILVEQGNTSAFADCVEMLMFDDDKRKEMSKKAVKVLDKFLLSSYIDTYENIFKKAQVI